MAYSKITAMHYCIPETRLTNEELAERFGEKQLLSIVKMAGVKERRIAKSDETASDLAYWACKQLIADRKIYTSDIDLIIFASQTHDYQIPATACVMHGRLGLSQRCAAFDINLGCTSFPYALSVADGMIASGIAKKALVINAETITKVINPRDRGLVTLHGDAAVATLLEPSVNGDGRLDFLLGTDGTGYSHLIMPASGARTPRTKETIKEVEVEPGVFRSQENLYMNGPAVFHFSVYKVPEALKEALAKFGKTVDDYDYVLLHQANKTMVDLVYRSLNVPREKRFYFMENVGNVSGASSAMILSEAWRQELIKPNSKVLLAAFGVGLSWGVVSIEWPSIVLPAVQGPVESQVETNESI